MTDDKKTDRWTRNLRNAGLIGEVEDAWTLSDVSPGEESVILVDGGRETEPPPEPVEDDGPEVIVINDEKSVRSASRSTDPVPPSVTPVEDQRRVMHERTAVGDHSGALEIAEQLLELNEDDRDASLVRLKCRKTLMQMYEARIGSFRRVPVRVISEEEIIWRNLDPVAGFIAASVDGSVSFEDIIDISTLPRFEACRVLSQLIQDGIIQ